MKLNIQPQTISFGSVTDLLAGPTGTPVAPRIEVESVTVTNATGNPVEFSLFKGASGGSVSGTQVARGSVPATSTLQVPVETVLESADVLTGTATSSGSLVINIDAKIGF